MCTGTTLLYRIPRVVVGENKNFLGAEDLFAARGVKLTVLQDPECVALMEKFVREKPRPLERGHRTLIDELTDFPGDRIKELRLGLRISQPSFWPRTRAWIRPDISRLEHGAEVRWSTLRRLFAALGYRVALEPVDEEDTDNFYRDMNYRRERRMEMGRERRVEVRSENRPDEYPPSDGILIRPIMGPCPRPGGLALRGELLLSR